MGFLAWTLVTLVVAFGLPALAAWEWQRRQPPVRIASPSHVRVVVESDEGAA